VKAIDIHKLLEDAVEAKGAAQVLHVLKSLLEPNTGRALTLTIISNAGIHDIPKSYLRGEVYEASHGDWNVETEEALILELTNILSRLAKKLRSRAWERIYLIPTGHPILSLQIKSMVYRILRVNTIDLYHKAGTYFEVSIDQRAIALGGKKRA
jgi:hypothetical protein